MYTYVYMHVYLYSKRERWRESMRNKHTNTERHSEAEGLKQNLQTDNKYLQENVQIHTQYIPMLT